MTTRQHGENRQILEEASAWFVEFRLGEIGRVRRGEFMQWLQRSPEHICAYIEISTSYGRLPTADSVDDKDVEHLLKKAASRANVVSMESVGDFSSTTPTSHERERDPRAARRRPILLAASIAALSVFALLAAWIALTTPPVYATTTAEHRSITLDDGSKVELNARTKVRVDFAENERHVELLEGQALFQVAKDPRRPFIVSSAGVNVRAVGTRFDVQLRRSGTTVTVLEGRVAVQSSSFSDGTWQPETTASVTHRDGVAIPLELTAGEQVVITPRLVAKPIHPNVAAATAWTHDELEFDETPLPDVAEEFNRHNRVPLLIDSPSLESFRISGVYSSEDPRSLIRFLQSQPDLLVTESPTAIRVRQK
jgi:transmembrane sensor